MPTSIRLDLVHTSPVVTTALRHELRRGERPLRVTTAVHSWVHFQEEWDFTGPFVVLDALLDDHVPLPLKVRALRRLGSQTIIIGPERETPFARRVAAEGAVAWIEPTVGLVEVAETIRDVCGGQIPHHARVDPAPAPLTTLTDRELQVLTLYVASRGHSPAHIGRILALRTSTIRSHLERGRVRYRAAGLPTNNRAALRAALEADGWTLPAHVWIEAGRP